MIQFLLAAPRSGSGKTTMTCALLMALKRRGCAPCAFKSGPDYIDPMFTGPCWGWRAAARPLFLCARDVRTFYARVPPATVRRVRGGHGLLWTASGGVSDRASAWHLPTRWACRCCWWWSQRVRA